MKALCLPALIPVGGYRNGATDYRPAQNQPHRADVAKLLVHEKARRKGAAMALMEALEAEARARNISVLVLDTSTGSGAETFYQRAGWQKVGEIPRYGSPGAGRCHDGDVRVLQILIIFVTTTP